MERHGWKQDVEEKWWTVEYTKKYKSITLAFIQAVNAGGLDNFRFAFCVTDSLFRSGGVSPNTAKIALARRHASADG